MTDVVVVEDGFSPISGWIFLLQGLIAAIFGVAIILWTDVVIDIIAIFIGALIVIYSISIILKGAAGGHGSKGTRALLIILGIIGIIIGILALMNLAVLWLTIAVLIAIWAFIAGFSDLWLGLTAETESGGYRALLVIAGIIGIAIGLFVIMMPIITQIVLFQVFGLLLLILGIIIILTGFYVQAKMKE